LRARVGIDGLFHTSFVVVNEEPGGHENVECLFFLFELDGGGYGVGGAAADLALIVYWRAPRSKVFLRWQLGKYRLWRRVKVVTMVGQIWSPTVLAIDRHVLNPPVYSDIVSHLLR
jgi:hypothetical protein